MRRESTSTSSSKTSKTSKTSIPVTHNHTVPGTNHVISPENLGALRALQAYYPEHNNSSKYPERFFHRFLKNQKYDVEKAKKMVDEYFAWRQAFQVDDICTNKSFTSSGGIKVNYPHGYHGVCKKGRPVYIERIGKVNVPQLLKVATLEELIEYYVQEYEHLLEVIMPACTLKKGSPVEETLTILDLEGFALFDHFSSQTKNLVSQVTQISQKYYPELMGDMIFVNAPLAFTTAWYFIKKLLSSETKARIHFGMSKVKEYVDPSSLPNFLGGDRDDPQWFESRYGPWGEVDILARVLQQQEHVPRNLYLLACQNDVFEEVERLACGGASGAARTGAGDESTGTGGLSDGSPSKQNLSSSSVTPDDVAESFREEADRRAEGAAVAGSLGEGLTGAAESPGERRASGSPGEGSSRSLRGFASMASPVASPVEGEESSLASDVRVANPVSGNADAHDPSFTEDLTAVPVNVIKHKASHERRLSEIREKEDEQRRMSVHSNAESFKSLPSQPGDA